MLLEAVDVFAVRKAAQTIVEVLGFMHKQTGFYDWLNQVCVYLSLSNTHTHTLSLSSNSVTPCFTLLSHTHPLSQVFTKCVDLLINAESLAHIDKEVNVQRELSNVAFGIFWMLELGQNPTELFIKLGTEKITHKIPANARENNGPYQTLAHTYEVSGFVQF